MSTLKSLVDETTNIKNELVTCHTDLKTILTDKSIDLTGNEKLLDLISEVGNISNKKWANGTAKFINTSISFNYTSGSTFNSGYIELSNIGFKPSVVIASYSNTLKDLLSVLYSPTNAYYTPCVKYVVGTYGTGELTGNNRNIKADSKVYVNNSLIRIPCPWDSGSNTWEWIAFE